MQTTDQKRARHALDQIELLSSNGKEYYGNFVSYAKSLPATIIINGLGQALAMELSLSGSGKKVGHKLLYHMIEDWLQKNSTLSNKQDLMKYLVTTDMLEYRRLQAEVLSYLSWVKKLAVAHLVQPDGDKVNE